MDKCFAKLAARSEVAALVLADESGAHSLIYLSWTVTQMRSEARDLWNKRGPQRQVGLVGKVPSGAIEFECEPGEETVMGKAILDFTLATEQGSAIAH